MPRRFGTSATIRRVRDSVVTPFATVWLKLGATARPGIHEERDRIKAAAAGFDLQFFGLSEGILRYRTPFFETNAMQAAGTISPNDWRDNPVRPTVLQ